MNTGKLTFVFTQRFFRKVYEMENLKERLIRESKERGLIASEFFGNLGKSDLKVESVGFESIMFLADMLPILVRVLGIDSIETVKQVKLNLENGLLFEVNSVKINNGKQILEKTLE